MAEIKLRYKPEIYMKEAIDKITVYGMWGDHLLQHRPKDRREVGQVLRSQGIDPDKLAAESRDYKKTIACFEDYKFNTWSFTPYPGGTGGIIDNETGEIIATLTEPGIIALSTYLEKFGKACLYRDRAVELCSFSEFHNAIISGITSIDSFILVKAQRWNRNHEGSELIDSNKKRIGLVRKLAEWVPKMTNGAKFTKDDKRWIDFIKLKKVRDDIAVHPKVDVQVFTYRELCELINAFRWGIAGILGQLHVFFNVPIPNVVINAVYMPEVEICEIEAG